MSTTVIDSPTVIPSSEPQRLSAISPFVKLVLGYGFLWGLVVGIIGQFVFRGMLEAELFRSQTLSIEFSWQIIGLEVISLAIALILAFIVLAFVWKAPSRRIAIFAGLCIGFVFALTTHMLFAGAANGALYNRDVWIFLHQNYSADDRPFLAILSSGIVRTLQEGTAFALVFLLIHSAIGTLAGFFLPVNQNQSSNPGKYAFGSVAALILPYVLFQTAFIMLLILPRVMEVIDEAESYTGQPIETRLIVAGAMLPTLLGGIVALLMAIIWAWKVDLETVHRRILRLSQILMAVFGGILILSTSQSYLPGLWDNLPLRFALIGSMGLAWLYAIVLQVRLQSHHPKRTAMARASNLSLLIVGLAVLLLSVLLMDMFGLRNFLNVVSYPVVMIADGIQDTANPNQRVTEIVDDAITNYWLALPQLLAQFVVIALAIYQPIVWLANKFER